MTGTIWEQVLGRIETKVNNHTYLTWFENTSLLRDSGSNILVQVVDPMAVDWMNKHYSGLIAEALTEVGRPGVSFSFLPEGGEMPALPASPSMPKSSDAEELEAGFNAADQAEPTGVSGLSPRYSFDTFIVGASNQFAHAACRAVAEAPSRSYNPLFLYGGVGLGKTHLMHAIGHYVLTHSPGLKLTYISAERFMNEVINAIRYDRILEFRERYRGVDILLVDDIQFIVGKERTQTEFFHTFNALHDAQKQIILSSDCPPHQITELEERLRSRFEWGLIADIQPPDLETKIAILKRKADAEGVYLPDDVSLFIAGRIKSNIRELEGSLIRLLAYASLTGRELSMSLAQEVLRDVLRQEERAVTIDAIQKFVAEYYQMKQHELKSRNNSKSVAKPRQVAMYLCKSLTNSSLPEIGKSFGGKHHSTVIHSIRKVEELRQRDQVFNTLINTLTESIRS
ncbi:MAG TPA: chromosomal replication initiator protein DnaA [Vicinamibacterales bacterium]|nr:chromosomal replication initiator protein DnaA [Vicinamibacterales bacterium]